MLTELRRFARRYELLEPGDTVYCAVSGGPDSMALLWGLYLLREQMGITLRAAHFNHNLRGAESDRDEAFVRDFCARYDIPLAVASKQVLPGDKGLEAAAREARYGFFDTLPGKLATAHTANDNAETVLLHLVRGTGLKGLGGIAPVRGRIIRPMLTVTRRQVRDFLAENYIPFVEDSSNETDAFLRNRLRHGVMPLLEGENPRIAENLSAMALKLRADDAALDALANITPSPSVEGLRAMAPAVRSRAISSFLRESGVREPEAKHIALAERLIFSKKPSAQADFPGGVVIRRCYDRLEAAREAVPLSEKVLSCPGTLELPELGIRVTCGEAETLSQAADTFTVCPAGPIVLRSRMAGDGMRTRSGTKSLKKLFIDGKIPASRRALVPVFADEIGILGVYGFGPNLDRTPNVLPAVQIRVESLTADG